MLAALGLLLAAAAAGAGYLTWELTRPKAADSLGIASAGLGTEFALTNQHGGTTHLGDLHGKAVLLFFGYTHCPDVCPATLHVMAQARELLGEDAARVQGVFISVDPARDTPERLGQYVGFFDDSFLGLTGSEQELRRVAKAFGAHFELDPPQADGSYLVAHTTFGYLLDQQGRVVKLFSSDAPPQEMADAARTVLGQEG